MSEEYILEKIDKDLVILKRDLEPCLINKRKTEKVEYVIILILKVKRR